MDLCNLKVGEPDALVNELAPRLRAAKTVEEACMLLCGELYERCRKGGDGERSLILSRIFLSLPFPALEPGVAAFAKEKKAGLDSTTGDMFLTLLGTRGDDPDWCDRKRSKGHQAIPLTRETVKKVPMMSRCFQQIGFNLDIVLKAEEDIHLDGVSSAFGVFHVEDAQGSPFVPAQDNFVKPRGVHSVLGCGTMLPNGAVSIWIGFLRHVVAQGAALPLVPMMPAFWHLIQPIYRRRALFVV